MSQEVKGSNYYFVPQVSSQHIIVVKRIVDHCQKKNSAISNSYSCIRHLKDKEVHLLRRWRKPPRSDNLGP